MDRPFGDVLRAWIALLPALARIGVRRLRRAGRQGRRTVAVVSGSSSAGTFSCEIGAGRPVRVDQRVVGSLSTHDDGGTSTAECALVLDPGTDREVVRLVIATATAAGFERGNHRACWRVSDDDATAIDVLREAGFTHEGKAPPLVQDPRTWQAWSRLSTEPAVPA